MSNHPSPKIVVVGPQGSGKSMFLASVCGIYRGTTTTCPVEWHLTPSPAWAATVAVAYYQPNAPPSATDAASNTLQKVGTVCSTPPELQLLLKKAELLTTYPGIDVSSVAEDVIDEALISTATSLSGSTIHIDLRCQQVTQEITIVDMPGIADMDNRDNQPQIMFVKQLICRYIESENTPLAVIMPATDPRVRSRMISFIKSINNWDIGANTILLNQFDCSTTFPSLPKILVPCCFYIHQLPSRVPFAYSSPGVQRLRQDEAAFFRFRQPWLHSQVDQHNFGVGNVLKAWNIPSTSPRISPGSQQIVHSRHGFPGTLCIWFLFSIITGLAVCLTL